jgi:hypothetical protein
VYAGVQAELTTDQHVEIDNFHEQNLPKMKTYMRKNLSTWLNTSKRKESVT